MSRGTRRKRHVTPPSRVAQAITERPKKSYARTEGPSKKSMPLLRKHEKEIIKAYTSGLSLNELSRSFFERKLDLNSENLRLFINLLAKEGKLKKKSVIDTSPKMVPQPTFITQEKLDPHRKFILRKVTEGMALKDLNTILMRRGAVVNIKTLANYVSWLKRPMKRGG